MQILIWIGAVVTLVGLAVILWSILEIVKAKRAGLDDETLRARLQRAVTVNLGAFFLSALGLIMVVAGIMLG
ncbi:MAG: hypothetical protein R3D78_13590 [Paracoccaceae bacterium]|uniref:Uncharacterized protein n=1 Tax=Pseudothioclava arenosa TaxID=1795308 RepID=A0A2A4CSV1_9RHOB|nr:hypothetical protein [Pseudothioclava arenosa]PCD77342.1 hypothetical protein CLN94_05190 [Pseudothioclava arenosa]